LIEFDHKKRSLESKVTHQQNKKLPFVVQKDSTTDPCPRVVANYS